MAQRKIVGENCRDANGVTYLPMSQQPIMVHQASGAQLSEILQKANHKAEQEGNAIAIYTEELFKTYNDEDNRAEVARHPSAELNLVGIAMRGKKNTVDRLSKGIALHP